LSDSIDESEQFQLGKMVGEAMATIRERERIAELIRTLQLTTIDPVTQEVTKVDMDWGPLFDQIHEPEDED
jgi:hypothetical protein